MPIILEGNITNRIIQGANGDFSVGTFCCDLGKFKIKDPLLDQFDEGEYRVRVAVQHLDIKSYPSTRNGIIITEIVAEIDAIDVIDAEIRPVEVEAVEPDASVSSVTQAAEAPEQVQSPSNTPGESDKVSSIETPRKAASEAGESDNDDLEALFGHLWPLGRTVKLDTTIPRALFIQQKQALKDRGYRFDAKTQTWSK